MQQSADFWWKSKKIFPFKIVQFTARKTAVGTAGVARRTEIQAAKTESFFLRFASRHFIGIRGDLIRLKERTFCRYLQFSQWKGECWIQEVIEARLDSWFTSFIDAVVSRGSKLRKLR